MIPLRGSPETDLRGAGRRVDSKKAWGNFLGEGNVLYVAWCGGYLGIYNCPNSSKCPLKRGHFIVHRLHQNACSKNKSHATEQVLNSTAQMVYRIQYFCHAPAFSLVPFSPSKLWSFCSCPLATCLRTHITTSQHTIGEKTEQPAHAHFHKQVSSVLECMLPT